MVLLILTLDVFVFQKAPSPSRSASFDPDKEVAKTGYGQQLIDIKSLITEDVELAQEKWETVKSRATAVPIELVYKAMLEEAFARKTQDQEKVAYHLSQQMALAEQYKLDWVIVSVQIAQSLDLARAGEVAQGLELIKKAIELGERINVDLLLLEAYKTAGALFNASNQLRQSQDYFYKGIELAHRYPTNINNSKLHNNLGLLYVHLEQWEKSLSYLKKAVSLYKLSDEKDSQALQVILLNQSFVYYKLNNAEKAREAYESSLAYFDENGNPFYQIVKLKAEARLNFLEGNYDETNRVIQQCITHPAISGFITQEGLCDLIYAKSLFEQGKYEKSLELTETSIDLFSKAKHERWLMRAYLVKVDLYEKLGEPQKALTIYKKYYAQDRERLLNQVYALENAFNTRKIEQERDFLDIQNELNELLLHKEQMRSRIAIVWVALCIIIVLIVMSRIFAVRSKNIELENISNVDPLTGIHNRRFYKEELKHLNILNASTHYCIVMMDLDKFKGINDQYGHDIGDEVLIETATRLIPLIQNDELFVRWGGEEFLCIIKSDEQLEQRIQGFLTALNQYVFRYHRDEIPVTISIGVSSAYRVSDLQQKDQPFIEADVALYKAKCEGRNRANFHVSKKQIDINF